MELWGGGIDTPPPRKTVELFFGRYSTVTSSVFDITNDRGTQKNSECRLTLGSDKIRDKKTDRMMRGVEKGK